MCSDSGSACPDWGASTLSWDDQNVLQSAHTSLSSSSFLCTVSVLSLCLWPVSLACLSVSDLSLTCVSDLSLCLWPVPDLSLCLWPVFLSLTCLSVSDLSLCLWPVSLSSLDHGDLCHCVRGHPVPDHHQVSAPCQLVPRGARQHQGHRQDHSCHHQPHRHHHHGRDLRRHSPLAHQTRYAHFRTARRDYFFFVPREFRAAGTTKTTIIL